MAGIATEHTRDERSLSVRREASIVTRYLPLIISTVAVAMVSLIYYYRGDRFLSDKWIAAEVALSITLALISAAIHTRVWTIRSAGVVWLMIGTLMLYAVIGAELWNLASEIDDVALAIMRAALVVSGPLMIVGVIQYNREKQPSRSEFESDDV
jgi:hypothetical protein